MKSKIDPVQTARTILAKPWGGATMEEAATLAKVVIAASEFIDACDKDPDDALCYPWKALFIALKGE